MYGYTESRIYPNDRWEMQKVEQLLVKEGIRQDENLEYTMGVYDRDRLVATGSFFKNTLRCLAVDADFKGEGLLNKVVAHLLNEQYRRNTLEVFLYTKCETARFFADLGFYEIASVDGLVTFMENRATGFSDYIADLAATKRPGNTVAAVIVNANPFTLGHQYLIEKAANENDVFHIFVVSEDVSLVPFAVRYELVRQGTAHLSNVVLHATGNYLISSATFPSYFIKDADAVIEAQAKLDIAIFCNHIAKALGIGKRYVGEEPLSHVTGIYNRIMQAALAQAGIACIVVPRRQAANEPISASRVRAYLHKGELEKIRPLVPPTTFTFFSSPAGAAVIKAIQAAQTVVHY